MTAHRHWALHLFILPMLVATVHGEAPSQFTILADHFDRVGNDTWKFDDGGHNETSVHTSEPCHSRARNLVQFDQTQHHPPSSTLATPYLAVAS
jgi:hypothetical protein